MEPGTRRAATIELQTGALTLHSNRPLTHQHILMTVEAMLLVVRRLSDGADV